MSSIKKERLQRWMRVGFCVLCIYATLYSVRPICEALKQYTPLSLIINFGMIALFSGVVSVFFKKGYIRKASTCFFLLLVAAVYLLGWKFVPIVEERVHFIEYGVLSFLIYQALALDFKDRHAYFLAFVIASLVGVGDEGIQHLLPNRYYQFQDICLNSVSSALGLVLVSVLQREKGMSLSFSSGQN